MPASMKRARSDKRSRSASVAKRKRNQSRLPPPIKKGGNQHWEQRGNVVSRGKATTPASPAASLSSGKKKAPKSPSNSSPRGNQNAAAKQPGGPSLAGLVLAGATLTAGSLGAFLQLCPPVTAFPACDDIGSLRLVKAAAARDFGQLSDVLACASEYRVEHEAYLVAAFVIAYVSLQTCAVPGPLLLSILAGALWPAWQAHLMVACCASAGATMCFLLSRVLGAGLLAKVEQRVGGDTVARARASTGEALNSPVKMAALVALSRVTPMPNILINLGFPHMGVPVGPFFAGTVVGLVPLNAVHILSGGALARLGRFEAGETAWILGAGGAVLAVLAVAFGLGRRRTSA